jgi:DNA (cytosine-5)-methyltransferase 1
MKSIELFAGAGGLGIGASMAGFSHIAVIERDQHACNTIRENQRQGFPIVTSWPLFEDDIRHFKFSDLSESADLVSGGPPCQPFSLGGKHQGNLDGRDMFPEAVRAVREQQPKAFVFENVKGLMRSSFADYFRYICSQFKYPEIKIKNEENWYEHLARLEQHAKSSRKMGLQYQVSTKVLNSANYGVPQKRERIFFVGFRSDLNIKWSFPEQTHSQDILLFSKWVSGKYWERHGISKRKIPEIPKSLSKKVRAMSKRYSSFVEQPWVTVRDVISDLPDATTDLRVCNISNHCFQPGARIYQGHTGSPLDEPAKTLKAGDHGVPGGENMLRRPDGSVRYFTVRESARLQSFPDEYIFNGSWTETMRQLGNAVPVKLAEIIFSSVRKKLSRINVKRSQLTKNLVYAN